MNISMFNKLTFNNVTTQNTSRQKQDVNVNLFANAKKVELTDMFNFKTLDIRDGYGGMLFEFEVQKESLKYPAVKVGYKLISVDGKKIYTRIVKDIIKEGSKLIFTESKLNRSGDITIIYNKVQKITFENLSQKEGVRSRLSYLKGSYGNDFYTKIEKTLQSIFDFENSYSTAEEGLTSCMESKIDGFNLYKDIDENTKQTISKASNVKYLSSGGEGKVYTCDYLDSKKVIKLRTAGIQPDQITLMKELSCLVKAESELRDFFCIPTLISPKVVLMDYIGENITFNDILQDMDNNIDQLKSALNDYTSALNMLKEKGFIISDEKFAQGLDSIPIVDSISKDENNLIITHKDEVGKSKDLKIPLSTIFDRNTVYNKNTKKFVRVDIDGNVRLTSEEKIKRQKPQLHIAV